MASFSSIDLPGLFKRSFEKFKQYASFIIGITCTFLVVALILQLYFYDQGSAAPTFQTQIISAVFMLVQLFLYLGFCKIMLYLVYDRHVAVNDLFNNFSMFFNYLAASFLYVIVVIVGLVLLIFPGIYLAIRLQFYPYYVIEDKSTAYTSLKQSFDATENLTLELFLFDLCVLALNFLGGVFFGIGIIFTYPLTTLATAFIFKALNEDADTVLPVQESSS